MANRLNSSGAAHARSLVASGKVNSSASWSFSAADGNKLLGDPPDWTRYGLWHMGVNPAQPEKTKARYSYPYGKNGVVYRSALRAIASRGSQQGDQAISSAASALLKSLDAKTRSDSVVLDALADHPHRFAYCMANIAPKAKVSDPAAFCAAMVHKATGTWPAQEAKKAKQDGGGGNPYHEPAGSPVGGRFAHGPSGGSSGETSSGRPDLKNMTTAKLRRLHRDFVRQADELANQGRRVDPSINYQILSIEKELKRRNERVAA